MVTAGKTPKATAHPLGVVMPAIAALVALVALGCGSAKLSAESSCKDYVNASSEEQDAAVLRVAQELQAPRVVTPLGRPNIDYICTSDPNRTLGSVISKYADQSAPASPGDSSTSADDADSEDAAPSEDDQALEVLQNNQELVPLGEQRGFQISGNAGVETSVYDSVVDDVRSRNALAKVLPDGVSLDAFAHLLPKALITVTPQDECENRLVCAATKVVTPDDTVDNVNWVVTFLPDGESQQDYLRAQRAR